MEGLGPVYRITDKPMAKNLKLSTKKSRNFYNYVNLILILNVICTINVSMKLLLFRCTLRFQSKYSKANFE